jgi:uncharacterized protein with GYD domain
VNTRQGAGESCRFEVIDFLSALTKENDMAKYVMLGNWTEQGVRNVKDTVERARGVRELFASMGVNAREFFWTMGQYDVILTFDAPDDETMMRATLAVVMRGNLRTTTLRALGEQEMERVLEDVR